MLFQNLKNFLGNIRAKYFLLAIVAFGFILRVNNLTIGFPQLFLSNDEAIFHQSALNMIANKTPFTLGNYGPLGAYVQIPFLLLASAILFITGKINSTSNLEFLLVTQEGYMLFIPRIISVTFGTLSILATYAISRDLFRSRRTALWSALIAAVCFNLVHISHLGRGWAPAFFFSLLSVKFAMSSVNEEKGRIKNTVISSIFAALAFGFHQLSGIVLVLIFLIGAYSGRFSKRNIFSKANIAGLVSLLSLILLFNWLSLGGNFFGVLTPENPTVGLVQLPSFSQGISGIWKYYAQKGVFFDLPYSLALSDGLIFGLGITFFLKRKVAKVYLPFLIFFVFNFLLLVLVLPIFVRYFLISISFFPIFAGFIIAELEKKRFGLLAVFVLVVLMSANSLYWNFLISRESTFDQLRSWVDANIPQETAIAAFDVRSIGYVPSNQAANVVRKLKPGYYLRASNLIGDSYPPNVRNIIYTGQFKAGSKSKNLETAISIYPVKYVIDWYTISKDSLMSKNPNVRLRLVAHFSPTGKRKEENYLPEILVDGGFAMPLTKVDRAGPYFDVLEVEK